MNVDDNKIVKSDESQNISQPVVDKSRRSFAKTGLVAPVILTLANRSAWGANVCTGSAFGSYSTAVVKPSHSAFEAIDGWRQPKNGLPATRNGWYELLGEWPAPYKPVHLYGTTHPTNNTLNNNGWYTSPLPTPAWTGVKNRAGVVGTNMNPGGVYPSPANIVFVRQLLGNSYDVKLTLYDALNAGGDLAYVLAGYLNQAKTPSISFPTLISSDYVTFYSNCAS